MNKILLETLGISLILFTDIMYAIYALLAPHASDLLGSRLYDVFLHFITLISFTLYGTGETV